MLLTRTRCRKNSGSAGKGKRRANHGWADDGDTEALQGLDVYATNSGSDASDSQTTFGLGDQREWTLLHYLGDDAIIGVPPHLIPHIDKAFPRSYLTALTTLG